MKHALPLLAFLVVPLITPSVSSALDTKRWILFAKKDDGALIYYDSRTIESGYGNTGRIWTITKFPSPSDGHKEITAYTEFDCREHKSRFIYLFTKYEGGKNLESSYSGSNFQDIPTGSVDERLFMMVCK